MFSVNHFLLASYGYGTTAAAKQSFVSSNTTSYQKPVTYASTSSSYSSYGSKSSSFDKKVIYLIDISIIINFDQNYHIGGIIAVSYNFVAFNINIISRWKNSD